MTGKASGLDNIDVIFTCIPNTMFNNLIPVPPVESNGFFFFFIVLPEHSPVISNIFDLHCIRSHAGTDSGKL